MMRKIILLMTFVLFLLEIAHSVFSIPPLPIHTTSISPPPNNLGTPEKVLEINFTINSSHQITLNSISIKNLPQAIVSTFNSDYYLKITDSNGQVLFQSNILVVFNPNTNISPEYYAIPYPNGARYLHFYYQNQEIAKYDIAQEFPWLYVIIGIVVVAIVFVIYFISRKYTIGF